VRIGFVPGYVLESGLGKKVAQLKGVDRGWSYPTFLIQYVRNPGPFLLFERLVIDEQAAEETIKYLTNRRNRPSGYESRFIANTNPTEKEVNVLDNLLKSKLFEKRNIEDILTEEDYEEIRTGYNQDTGIGQRGNSLEPMKRFNQALSIMKEKYGPAYASPSPEFFEAMNLNLIKVISRKLSVLPLDDICRIPLYEVKSIYNQRQAPATYDIAFKVVQQARQILYLPSDPVKDPDKFLELHKDKRVQSFRKKIQDLAEEKADRNKIPRELVEAEEKLKELSSTSWTITIGLLGLPAGAYGILSGNFVSGALGAIPTVVGIGKAIFDKWNVRKYDWLNVIKGFSEV
jgi:hypothetical protein